MFNYFRVIFIVLIFGFTFAQSQSLITPVTMSKNLESARSEAKGSGLLDPKLIAVLTANQELDYLGQKISVAFDLESGKSGMWIYVFIDNSATKQVYGVLSFQTFVGPQFIDIPTENLSIENFSTSVFLDDFAYMGSEEVIKIIKENSDFVDYYSNNTPLDAFSVALFSSLGSEGLLDNQPYWGFVMVKGDKVKMCSVHAIDATSVCSPDIINSINDDNMKNSISAYPNPAEDVIDVDDFYINGGFDVYDVYGRKIENFDYSLKQNGITMNISNLSSGVYYLRTKQDYLLFIKK